MKAFKISSIVQTSIYTSLSLMILTQNAGAQDSGGPYKSKGNQSYQYYNYQGNSGSKSSSGSFENNGSDYSSSYYVSTVRCEDFLVKAYKFSFESASKTCRDNTRLAEKIDSDKFDSCVKEISSVVANPNDEIICIQLQKNMELLKDESFKSCLNKSLSRVSANYFVYEALYNSDRSDNRVRRLVDECKASLNEGPSNDVFSNRAEVVNQFYIHTSAPRTQDSRLRFGGLSGLWFDRKESKFVGISDDEQQPFIAQFKWDIENPRSSPNSFEIININKSRMFKNNDNGGYYYGKSFDYEDIVKLPNGNFLASNEVDTENAYIQILSPKGEILERFPYDPMLDSAFKESKQEYDCSGYEQRKKAGKSAKSDGESDGSSNNYGKSNGVGGNIGVSKAISFSIFGGSGDFGDSKKDDSMESVWVKKTCHSTFKTQIQGMQNNKAIEALTFDPVSQNIFYGSEGPLIQDNEDVNSQSGFFGGRKRADFVRIFRQHLTRTQEISSQKYPLESSKDFGLVALAAVDADHIYTMERVYDSVANTTLIRIFLVDFNRKGADGLLVKEKIADLGQLKSQLNGAFKKLDNFEGMTLVYGQSGQKYLVLISDNNFSESQVTGLLVLKIK